MTGFWDIHAHVLPGIDDGAKDWDMSMNMIQKSFDAGVRHIIATPHYLPWQKHNAAKKDIGLLCAEANRRIQKELGEDIEILPGQEIYYHVDILKDLAEGKAQPLAGGKHVLVEFAENIPFSEMMAAAGKFRRSPFRVVAAHFERYEALRKQENLEQFLQAGVLLQSNIGEMKKGLFDSGKRFLQKAYAAGLVSFTASDMHNLSSRPPISEESLKWFRNRLDPAYMEDLFCTNPEKLPGNAQ